MTAGLKRYRVLLGVAAAILVMTGVLHATGFAMVAQALEDSGLPGDWVPVFKGLWVMFSIHLVILAGLLAAFAAFPAGRAPLAAAVAMPVADTLLLLVTVGVFVGSIMTGLAAVAAVSALVAHPASASKR